VIKAGSREQKYHIIYIRAILSLSIILLALYNIDAIMAAPFVSAVFITLLALSNLVLIYVPVRFYSGVRLHYIIFLLDITFIVLASHLYSQLNIEFVLAVFLSVFMAALSQSVKLSFIIAIVVNMLYFYINYRAAGDSFDLLTERSLLNIPFVFIVALHSSYIAEKANHVLKEKEELEKEKDFLAGEIISKDAEINKVKKFAYDLCSSFNEAVIILDLKGNLRLGTEKAASVLGMKNIFAPNIPFSELDFPPPVKDIVLKLTFAGEPTRDNAISVNVSGAEKKVVVNTAYIKDTSGNKLGILLTAKEAF